MVGGQWPLIYELVEAAAARAIFYLQWQCNFIVVARTNFFCVACLVLAMQLLLKIAEKLKTLNIHSGNFAISRFFQRTM